MGLFSSVLHVSDQRREAVLPALDAILQSKGFSRAESLPITAEGPYALPNYEASSSTGPYYLVSPLNDHWLTIVESHFALESIGAPDLWDLAIHLGKALTCYTLALVVHDDDLFFYNLYYDGECLDSYNSCPQYFERDRLQDEQIQAQRHSPEWFERLLPAGRSLDELRALLNRGWWSAYDSGSLDEYGVARGNDDGFVFEGERMTAFGTFLQLHGMHGKYPFAAWGEATGLAWSDFMALSYQAK